MNSIELDGSHAEGGGQILRTALSLSAILQKPFAITNVRANRPKPGLQAQHLTAVNSCAQLCGASVEGNLLNSTRLSFSPAAVQSGNFFFSVGTAGSTTLVLQTLLPVALFAHSSCKISVEGGTENHFAPTSFYLTKVFLPMLAKMGVPVTAQVESYGWYPKGGGKLVAKTAQPKKLVPLQLSKREGLSQITGFSLSSNLPAGVRERMKSRCLRQLGENSLSAKVNSLDLQSPAIGAEFFLLAEFENTFAGFTAMGELKKPAERVVGESVHLLLQFLQSGACIDMHLADQLLIYCALAKGESSFSTEKISSHLKTNAKVIREFLPGCEINLHEETSGGRVTVKGAGLK